tara:strand:- start:32 stop:577 length:546 start_codon:yes stop_codon:yes gene_type:complete
MKKLIVLLLGLSIASCSYESNVPGPVGPQGPPGPGLSYRIIDATALYENWLPFNNPGEIDYQYYQEFNAPEIDQYTFDNGLVIGYQIDGGTTYTLPNTINFDGYTREFSLYYGVGYVGFICKDSDLQSTPPDVDQYFKVYIVNPSSGKRDLSGMSQTELELYLREMKAEGSAREIKLTRKK